ncbi:hypothetical protein [Umezawaea sp. Da 62-37]|uniref:hypothetical protein n=1 Tax=Umezawaea sp. Da 62-37 TaxID=3075927 RepID=UPI0028F6F837|nr:hypothetical protein [Umezawaea sp. Da 62-37]WNV88003.1 hypothetical protein RM788_06865 [Umezawaea sp. Da 62-37]
MSIHEEVGRATTVWRQLGIRPAVVDTMASELALELTLAAERGQPISERTGGDVAGFAMAWARDRGLLVRSRPPAGFLAAAARGAWLPAFVAVVIGYLSWGRLVDQCSALFVPCDSFWRTPWMWAGWVLCGALAHLLVLRSTSRHVRRSARLRTTRKFAMALSAAVVGSAVLGIAVGSLGEIVFGHFAILVFPIAFAVVVVAMSAGAVVAFRVARSAPASDRHHG